MEDRTYFSLKKSKKIEHLFIENRKNLLIENGTKLLVAARGAYRASRARIALGSTRARLKFLRLGSARELV